MILGLNDIIDEIYDEFDLIEEKSIDKIIRHGHSEMKKLFSRKNELVIEHSDFTITKFFIPMTPEDHRDHTFDRYRARKAYEKKNPK